MSSTFFNLSPEESQRALFLLYQEKVRKLSEKNFKKSDILNKHLRGKGWSLDHRMSIKECFDKELPPEFAADVANLEMVPEGYNKEKGRKSSVSFEELTEEMDERDYLN